MYIHYDGWEQRVFPKKMDRLYNQNIQDGHRVVQWGDGEKDGQRMEEEVVAQYNIRPEHNSTHTETSIRKNGLI